MTTPITQTQINTEINTQLPTNGVGAITATILRGVLTDMNSATFQMQTGWINVKWFGATGDGITDDAAAFQAALTYCAGDTYNVNATVLYCPHGTYKIGSRLTQRCPILWRGDGERATFGALSGSHIVFSHADSGCIFLDPTGDLGSSVYIEGTSFEDISFNSTNVAVLQHCIVLAAGDMLAQGGFNRVLFSGFTGCCIYTPAGSNAYNQNVSVNNVSCTNVGGFIGADNSLALTLTMLTVTNFNLENGVNTTFPQHAFFDLRTIREVNMKQMVIEGGSLNTTIFRLGGNSWNYIDGVHIEPAFVAPVNTIEFITPPYAPPSGGATIRAVVASYSNAFIYFNNVSLAHVNIVNCNGSAVVDWGVITGSFGNVVDFKDCSLTTSLAMNDTLISKAVLR